MIEVQFLRRWHGRTSPVSEAIQPRCRYVRNIVRAPFIPDAPAVDGTFVNISYNFMTPIDADRTRYFWFQHRNGALGAEVSEYMNDGARIAFLEDKEFARHKLPERLELLDDFPLSTFGKVSKKSLVEMVAAKLEQEQKTG